MIARRSKLLHFQSLCGKEDGFTLIELLVVIIIVGILSAVALPSFLNQRSKAKQTEAETNTSAVNVQQNTFFTENDRYAAQYSQLAVGSLTANSNVETTNNYEYVLGTVGTTPPVSNAYITADPISGSVADIGLSGYTGITHVYLAANQPIFSDLVCITDDLGIPGVPPTGAEIPLNATASCPTTPNAMSPLKN